MRITDIFSEHTGPRSIFVHILMHVCHHVFIELKVFCDFILYITAVWLLKHFIWIEKTIGTPT